jgi:glycosyltransferase involved in cell wall biosynthesis
MSTISILFPIYNGEKYLKKSIESLLNQTYTDFEILIGFNGTIDKSKEIIQSYDDKRIKVFDYGDDSGKGKTLNKLLKESQSDILAVQDDDDIWLNKKLEHQIKYINDFDIVGTQILYINDNEDIIGGPNPNLAYEDIEIKNKSYNGDNQIASTSALFKKKTVQKIEGWKENIDGIEDFDLWLRLMKSGCIFKNINTVEVLHRIHSRSNFNTKKHDLKKIL